jgi:hypothetical protein
MALASNLALDTPRMQALLDLASGRIRQFTNQTLSVVLGDQVEFGPRFSTLLVLPQVPVLAVSSITVDAVAVTDFNWFRWGNVFGTTDWTEGAIVTYDHGYLTTSDEYALVKGICIASATRAFTMNERSASEAFGSTLMETAGYSPEIFLTPGEQADLRDFDVVAVG